MYLCLVRRFEGLVAQGRSPTEELLNDWGTINSTVGELVDILKSHKLLAPACVLIPGMNLQFLIFYFYCFQNVPVLTIG